MAQQVKNPLAMQETQQMQVQSLGQACPLEKEMATQSSILAWEIPWQRSLQYMGQQKSQTWLSNETQHRKIEQLVYLSQKKSKRRNPVIN